MSYTQPPGRPSPGQTCRLILVFTVLLQVALQSFSGAVTYLYFTHQLKQVSLRQSQQLSASLSLFYLLACSFWKAFLWTTANAHNTKDFLKL